MKYLESLMELECFSRQDVVSMTGSEDAAHSLLYDYLAKGYIERVRRDLYVAISLETKQPVANRYKIASHLADDACISYHTAFEYFGYGNQVFYEVYVLTHSRFRSFVYDGVSYTRVSPKIAGGIITDRSGVRTTDLERTVIDSIHGFEKIGGLEELLRCLLLIPSLNGDKLIQYLDEYGLSTLYQRVGYIFDQLSGEIGIPERVMTHCQKRLPESKRYLYVSTNNKQDIFVFHPEWRLFAPKRLMEIVIKGVYDGKAG